MGVSSLYGITFVGKNCLAIDSLRGFLLRIDPETDNATVVNPYQTSEFADVTGLAVWSNDLWFTRYNTVYVCREALVGENIASLKPEPLVTLPYNLDGIAVWNSTLYISSQQGGCIFVYSLISGREITRF